MWDLFNRMGIDIHHEGVGPEGAISWLFAVRSVHVTAPVSYICIFLPLYVCAMLLPLYMYVSSFCPCICMCHVTAPVYVCHVSVPVHVCVSAPVSYIICMPCYWPRLDISHASV
jgi:hypothetical protein